MYIFCYLLYVQISPLASAQTDESVNIESNFFFQILRVLSLF